jgi:uncharacterized damage-inducible protein DinB
MKRADERQLAAVPSGGSPGLLTTLNHIYRAEAVWLRRVLGGPAAQLAHIADAPDAESLRILWRPVNQGWIDWAHYAAWEQMVPRQDSRGNKHALPAWQIAMHVVNHESCHRGQAVAQMREAGLQPLATDMVIFYRGDAGTAAIDDRSLIKNGIKIRSLENFTDKVKYANPTPEMRQVRLRPVGDASAYRHRAFHHAFHEKAQIPLPRLQKQIQGT